MSISEMMNICIGLETRAIQTVLLFVVLYDVRLLFGFGGHLLLA